VAVAVGAALGIKEIEAELLPEDKLARVQALVAQKRKVAMTRPRSPKPMSGLPWDRAPTSPRRAPTWCCWATISSASSKR
jgi:hypothetical protein